MNRIVAIATAAQLPLSLPNENSRCAKTKRNMKIGTDDSVDDDSVHQKEAMALFPNESSAITFGKFMEKIIGYDVMKKIEDQDAAEQAKLAALTPIIEPIVKVAIASILDVQSFRVKRSEIIASSTSSPRDCNDWLSFLFDLTNGNKHIELAQHVHSATLNKQTKGLIEVTVLKCFNDKFFFTTLS